MNNTQTVQSTNNNTLQQSGSNLQVPNPVINSSEQLEQQGLSAPTLRVGQSIVTPKGTNQPTPDSSFMNPLALLIIFVLLVTVILVIIIRRKPEGVSETPEVLPPVTKKTAIKKKAKSSKHRPRKKSQSKK